MRRTATRTKAKKKEKKKKKKKKKERNNHRINRVEALAGALPVATILEAVEVAVVAMAIVEVVAVVVMLVAKHQQVLLVAILNNNTKVATGVVVVEEAEVTNPRPTIKRTDLLASINCKFHSKEKKWGVNAFQTRACVCCVFF
jgi:ABC-type anion transport system duplicated permease subunit